MPINQVETDKFISRIRKVKGDAVADNVLQLIQETVPDVEILESSPQTTQDHYGLYLNVIKDQLSAVVFICAGANKNGVRAAARINQVKGMCD